MDAIRGRPADPETHLLWNAIAHLCPAGPPPCAAIARRTGLPDATVSDWFRNRYVPPWERFTRLLEYFPPAERGRLTDLWTAAWRARQTRARSESPQPAPARIAHLPHDITDFTGRRREVRTLADLILDPPNDVGLPIVVVQGMAGAGKTRLAVHVLRRLNVSAGEVQLYVDLGGFSARREPVDPAAALAGLLRHLGTPDAEIPSDLDARAALYRDRLDGRHAVVLLDNALSAEQVRPLVPGSPTCRVLVTSRRSLDGLDGTRHLRLGVFDTDEALALLSAIVGAERVAAEEDAALRVVELTGRLPLAVSLVARRLRARPSWRLADVAVLLEAEESRLSRLASDDVAVRAAFAVSYELLADGHRRLFRRLASLPGRDFCVHAAAAVAAVPVPDAAEILEALLDEHLLDDAGLGRYGWHDLVALFARERFLADEDAAARDIAVRRGLESYLLTADRARRIAQPHYRQLSLPARVSPAPVPVCPLPSPDDCQSWYDAERHNLRAATNAAAAAGHDDIAWQLATALFGFCHARQSWRDYQDILATAHAAARRLGDALGDAWLHNFRGIAAAELGSLDAARHHFAEAVAISRAAEDPDGEGQALNNLGEVLRRSGDAAGAIALYRRDLELSRCRHDIRATAICLDNIAKAELDLGNQTAATRTLTEALAVARSGGAMIVEAEILRDLGAAAVAAGDMLLAGDHFRRSAELYERLSDPAGAVETMIRHAETAAPDDSAFVEALRDGAGRLLPKLDEPFSGRLRRRLDKLIEELASGTQT